MVLGRAVSAHRRRVVGADGRHAGRSGGRFVKLRRALAGLALLAGGAALAIAALATITVVVLSAGGALTTPPGAWVAHVRPVAGLRVKLSVPGLVRFATSPLALRLLDGRAVDSRIGRLHFARDGGVLQVDCAP